MLGSRAGIPPHASNCSDDQSSIANGAEEAEIIFRSTPGHVCVLAGRDDVIGAPQPMHFVAAIGFHATAASLDSTAARCSFRLVGAARPRPAGSAPSASMQQPRLAPGPMPGALPQFVRRDNGPGRHAASVADHRIRAEAVARLLARRSAD